MQQRAQLCFNGNFLVDRSEYPPLASRVLTSSGVAALPKRRDAYAQDGAQGHLHPRGLGGIPSTEAQSAPSPNVAVSHEPAVNHIHEPPATSNLLRDHARTLGLRREISPL